MNGQGLSGPKPQTLDEKNEKAGPKNPRGPLLPIPLGEMPPFQENRQELIQG